MNVMSINNHLESTRKKQFIDGVEKESALICIVDRSNIIRTALLMYLNTVYSKFLELGVNFCGISNYFISTCNVDVYRIQRIFSYYICTFMCIICSISNKSRFCSSILFKCIYGKNG